MSPNTIADFITDDVFTKKPEPLAAKFGGDLPKFTGVYKGRARGWDAKATITMNDSTLVLQWNDKATPLTYLKETTWLNGETKIEFSGRDGLKMIQPYGIYVFTREKEQKK